METPLTATCLSMKYWPSNGLPISPTQRFHPGQKYGESEFIVNAMLGSKEIHLNVQRTFKARIGRLTKPRRSAIESTMPETIEVDLEILGNAQTYFVSEGDLCDWVERVSQLLA